MRKIIGIVRGEPLLLVALPFSLISLSLIFILRPLIKIRIGFLRSDRIGHFAANTELYLCMKDANINMGSHRTVDLFYFPRKPCNHQLARMWKRKLVVLPWFFMRPLDLIIRSFKCLSCFHAFEARGGDRDIDNLYEKFPSHLQFTTDEEILGEEGLLAMGIPIGAMLVCLNVRDSAYLTQQASSPDTYSYHNYRDSNIQNYVMAAESLADRGYYIIRMGAKVLETINSSHPKVIDYATNGMRSDFMDIYLGAKCTFCISTSTGYDAVPTIFRRPVVFVNSMPIGINSTFCDKYLSITKHHFSVQLNRLLSLSEIFSYSVGFSVHTPDYVSNGVNLIENTPEEIRDVAIEMEERLAGTWQVHEDDEALQQRFWENFPTDAVRNNGVPFHGEIRSRFGADFLRNNKEWLS
jgi:putative glycosyltransferase (TIGR04372 family)